MEQSPEQVHQKNWYDKSYKLLLLIPIAIFIFCVVYLGIFYSHNGDIIYKDVSLTGGTTITVFTQMDSSKVSEALRSQFPDIVTRVITDIRSGEQKGFFIETASSVEEVKPALEKELGFTLTEDNSSVEFTGSTLSSSFYQQLRLAILISFVLMAIVVFIIFRTPIRSLSVVIAAFADIIMTITVIDLLGIKLSTAGIVALLMLIGYSVDVDILLTTRAVKQREGTLNYRIWGAFKTGITMTLTAIAAITVALIFTAGLSDTLAQMFTIILIGLGFDIMNCWITNASILKWYAEATHKL